MVVFLLILTLESWGNSAYKKPSMQSSMAKVLSLQDALLQGSTRLRERWRHCKNSALRAILHIDTNKNQNFFGSRVTHFSRDPSRSSTGSYDPCFQGSFLPRQYHQWTTYAHENSNSCLKILNPLGLTLRCMPYGRVTLRTLLRRIL